MSPPFAPVLISVILFAAATAFAQDAGQPEASTSDSPAEPPTERLPSIDPEWTVQIEPSMWYVAPSGKVRLPVNSGTGPGGFTTAGDEMKVERLNLDSTRLLPAGEFHLSSDRWRFSFSAATFNVDAESTSADSSFRLGAVEVAEGDPIDASMDFTTAELTVGYRFAGRDFRFCTEDGAFCIDAALRVYALAGARIYDVSFDLTNRDSGASAAAAEFFGEPIIGLRAETEFADQFTLDLQVAGGGFADSDRSSYSFDIMAGFHWRPTDHVGVQIGYRQLLFDLTDGDELDEFSYGGRLAGLFAGLTIRF